MVDNVHQLRPKPNDSEKVTINLGFVDLGHIDLMVQEGFYSNRTDFIRTAIRNQLERHAEVVKQSTARKSLHLGLRNYSRQGGASRRRDARDQCIRPRHYRAGCHPRTRTRHYRFGRRAGSVARKSGGQGRPS
jgi:Arc/MetJ-type ribon-helix-helix transcriptional regulator